jgi:acyl-CoA dehydrogenase
VRGLTNQEYAPLAEIMGAVPWASEVFNCSAPDTGNMETIARYGSEEIKARWLKPLLEGEIRSAFAMTEPDVASSDATNIATRIERQGDAVRHQRPQVVDLRCGRPALQGLHHHGQDRPRRAAPFAAEHGRRAGRRQGHPHRAPAQRVRLRRRAARPRRDVLRERAVPVGNILLGEGRGFEIAQGRLGPGRIHHCMRLIGLAERALELMCRALSRAWPSARPWPRRP